MQSFESWKHTKCAKLTYCFQKLQKSAFGCLKSFVAPYLTLEKTWELHLSSVADQKKSKNFVFLTEIGMTQNVIRIHEITLKTPFSSSKRLVGIIQYLGVPQRRILVSV